MKTGTIKMTSINTAPKISSFRYPEAAAKKHGFKDPGSAITHLIGAILAVFATPMLLMKASVSNNPLHIAAMAVFMSGMILLYTASTLYHSLDISAKVNRRLKKFDHMMISVLIAASYTPVCLIALNSPLGVGLLIAIWTMALAGIIFKAFWVTCPKWVSSILYITMGWLCIIALPQLWTNLSVSGFMWLLIGGLMYTIGGVIYALKLPIFNSRHQSFGSHEVFHLFVMAGSFCHFMLMYLYLA